MKPEGKREARSDPSGGSMGCPMPLLKAKKVIEPWARQVRGPGTDPGSTTLEPLRRPATSISAIPKSRRFKHYLRKKSS
jgi:hypothetical protein